MEQAAKKAFPGSKTAFCVLIFMWGVWQIRLLQMKIWLHPECDLSHAVLLKALL